MRVVNMAHGSLYLIAAYVAIELQRADHHGQPRHDVTRRRSACSTGSSCCSSRRCVAGLIGLAMQQLFLRWNQGQDLRQALITIALSVIVADQIVVHTGGGVARTCRSRAASTSSSICTCAISATPAPGSSSSGSALVIGLALWLWFKHTRTGMVIRAGVDDRAMVSALGVNIQRVFVIAFFVGAMLAGIGARASVRPRPRCHRH